MRLLEVSCTVKTEDPLRKVGEGEPKSKGRCFFLTNLSFNPTRALPTINYKSPLKLVTPKKSPKKNYFFKFKKGKEN